MAILFKNDWRLYPTAIVDTKTKNESFLRLASLYRSMGIDNYYFILALINPQLQGVDPHSTNLTEEQRMMINAEIVMNPWYYIREVVRIPPNSSVLPIPFEANRGNIALMWACLNNIDYVSIQPRQTGKSVGADVLMNYVLHFAMENSRINLITKDAPLRADNIERLKMIRNLMPPYTINLSSDDTDNKIGLTYNAAHNRYTTSIAQNSVAGAANVGRGTTAPITQFDELAFLRNLTSMLSAALAAGTASRNEAKENGMYHFNLFTTTAGKKDDKDGKYAYDLITGGAPWSETFFDLADNHELKKVVKKNSTGEKALINGTFNHRMLGKTDEWLLEAIRNANAKGEEADRDFFCRWTSGTQSSPLSPKLNNVIAESVREADYVEYSQTGYMLKWYIPQEELVECLDEDYFALGIDTSDAVGRDSISAVLTNLRTMSMTMGLDVNETNLMNFATWIADFLIAYPNVTLVIEMKSSARTIVDVVILRLIAVGINPFTRIFNRLFNNPSERKDAIREVISSPERKYADYADMYRSLMGFDTNPETRKLLYGPVLLQAAKQSGHLVQDRTLSEQIRALVVKGGRIDHVASGHDDKVIAWLLTHYFAIHAKNISYYGIPTEVVLSEVSDTTEPLTERELIEKEIQQSLREEIEDIVEELVECQNGFRSRQLEVKLSSLSHRLKGDDRVNYTYDQLRQRVEEERERRFQTESISSYIQRNRSYR